MGEASGGPSLLSFEATLGGLNKAAKTAIQNGSIVLLDFVTERHRDKGESFITKLRSMSYQKANT